MEFKKILIHLERVYLNSPPNMNIVIDNIAIFHEEKVSSRDNRHLCPKLHLRPPTTALLFLKLYRRLPTKAVFSQIILSSLDNTPLF